VERSRPVPVAVLMSAPVAMLRTELIVDFRYCMAGATVKRSSSVF
jgi:hypothetical protein